jgi:trehalose monomycolate/heme transporter
MLGRLTEGVVRRRWWILAACAVLTAAAAAGAPGLFDRLGYPVFYDPAAPSSEAKAYAQRTFGDGDPDVVALYHLPDGIGGAAGVDARGVRRALAHTLGRIAREPYVARVIGATSPAGDRFVSRDRRSTFVVISLRGQPRAKAEALVRLQRLLPLELPDAAPITPLLGGMVPSGRSLTHLARQSLARGERIALPIVALLLFVIFDSAVAALLPLIIGGASMTLTLGVLTLLVPLVSVDAFAINVVTILGLGVAIDYALFLVSRHREEVLRRRATGPDDEDLRRRALVHAVSTTGRAVFYSAITVSVSLAGLFFFPQPFLRSVAIGGMVVVLVAALLALVLLPALLSVIGARLERWRLPAFLRRRDVPGLRDGGWRRFAALVIRHRVAVCVGATLFLLLLASPFTRLQPSRSDVRALPKSEEPRRLSDLLTRDFPAATLTPTSVALVMDGDVIDEQRLGMLFDYTAELALLPGVSHVESILSYARAGDRDAAERLAPALERYAARPTPRGQLGLGTIVRGPATLLRVVSQAPPDSPEGQRLVRAIRDLPPPAGARVLVYGQAVALYDFGHGLRVRAHAMLLFVAAAMFVILCFAFRTLVLPLKAMVMTSLSLTASFGALVYIFQDGRLQSLLGYEAAGTTDATLPVVMFAVIFGLSMDYEVLILGRVREEYLRTRDNDAAIVEGMARTGRLVTRAAAVMIVVFSAFTVAPVLFIKALGFGMALAIFLDATIVRMLLVPSTMALLGRLNWWAPKWRRWSAPKWRERRI